MCHDRLSLVANTDQMNKIGNDATAVTNTVTTPNICSSAVIIAVATTATNKLILKIDNGFIVCDLSGG
jgi:hypothetical protein